MFYHTRNEKGLFQYDERCKNTYFSFQMRERKIEMTLQLKNIVVLI